MTNLHGIKQHVREMDRTVLEFTNYRKLQEWKDKAEELEGSKYDR